MSKLMKLEHRKPVNFTVTGLYLSGLGLKGTKAGGSLATPGAQTTLSEATLRSSVHIIWGKVSGILHVELCCVCTLCIRRRFYGFAHFDISRDGALDVMAPTVMRWSF